MQTQDDTPRFLLIVRERLRPGSEDPYDQAELRIAAVSAGMRCPHPYLALASASDPLEVWWLNAFASQAEKDDVDAAYARNEALMTEMRLLGKRKAHCIEAATDSWLEYRPERSDAGLRIAGSRFLVIGTSDPVVFPAAIYESAAGERLAIAATSDRAAAKDLASNIGSKAVVLAVQPRWSFPARAWIDADVEFWSANPAAGGPGVRAWTGAAIRRASEADAAAILLAHLDSIHSLGPLFYPPDIVEAWSEGLVAEVYVNAMRGGEAFFIATGLLDGQDVVLGFATHRVDDAEDGASVYVRGRAARMGVGTALLREAEQHARLSGARSIQIQASRAGVEFYKANGFEELGVSEAVLMSGKRMPCVLMRKRLRYR
jgi:GNAT superfamily N-acetyltransferase